MTRNTLIKKPFDGMIRIKKIKIRETPEVKTVFLCSYKIFKKSLVVVMALVMMLAELPILNAFEAHVINVTAKIERREVITPYYSNPNTHDREDDDHNEDDEKDEDYKNNKDDENDEEESDNDKDDSKEENHSDNQEDDKGENTEKIDEERALSILLGESEEENNRLKENLEKFKDRDDKDHEEEDKSNAKEELDESTETEKEESSVDIVEDPEPVSPRIIIEEVFVEEQPIENTEEALIPEEEGVTETIESNSSSEDLPEENEEGRENEMPQEDIVT